jgi:uncharacterized protein YegP (UPF0339 family)
MRFHRYIDTAGRWRWRLYAGNNLIVADSGQGYSSLADCDYAIALIKNQAPSAPLT